ncbi:MAG: hypothetical protein ACRDGQ_10330 [Candidatus Limnocylindrales bacterium]
MALESGTDGLLRLVAPDETLHATARASDHHVLVTDRRLAVAENDRVALDIPLANVRRIQFDIEKTRPATLVIVPESPLDPPQVLTVPPNHYDEIARALVAIGLLISD